MLAIGIRVPLSHWKNQIDTFCIPGHLGFAFLSECSGSPNQNLYDKMQKVVMSIMSAVLYSFTTATVFIQYIILAVKPYCIMNYLRLFMSKINYELQRANNGINNSNQIDKLCLMYKEIKLLVCYLNWFHGRTFIHGRWDSLVVCKLIIKL